MIEEAAMEAIACPCLCAWVVGGGLWVIEIPTHDLDGDGDDDD